jgi:hypothetical protein
MARDDRPLPSPRTTIVGGRPPESGDGLPPVPTGIQRLLRLAAVDDDFADELVRRPLEVARTAGVPLTRSEAAILASIPAQQIVAMAAQLPAPPPRRREFLRQTAATAVVLLGGAALPTALTGCCPVEDEPGRPDINLMQGEGGADPEEPPVRVEHREMESDGGISPDLVETLEPTPPEEPVTAEEPPAEDSEPRPQHNEMTRRGGAKPDLPPEDGE